MRHLNEEELIDLAEGTRPESSSPHLASCEVCRRQLQELRAVMTEASHIEVPEPSPLFWDHLSARVHDSIANEVSAATESSRTRWAWWFLPAGALAAIVLAAAITFRGSDTPIAPSEHAPAVAGASTATSEVAAIADDPSLSLIANLAGEVDWDAVADVGFTSATGSVDRAVFDLTPEERVELQRILKEEMSKS